VIPIRDNIRSRSIPITGYILIISTAVIFMKELMLEDGQLDQMVATFGLIPAVFLSGLDSRLTDITVYLPLVTNLFLHGGWLHVIGNLWYLKIFGDNVEDRLGHGNFLIFYLLCGIIANLAQVIVDPASTVPTIGASGAISGVLGAYFISFPLAKVSTLIPIFFFVTVIEIPAMLFLGLWFVLQLQSGTASLYMAGTNVAWWAHIGGFAAGVILVKLFPRRNSY
jgi:membrane associated rhomboid family serine protease